MATSQLIEEKKTITLNVFGYKVVIVFTTNVVKSARNRNANLPINDDNVHACCLDNPNLGQSIIIYPYDPSISATVHEVVHAVQNLMNWIGTTDREFAAYHTGYLVSEIVHFSWKHKRPKTRKKNVKRTKTSTL